MSQLKHNTQKLKDSKIIFIDWFIDFQTNWIKLETVISVTLKGLSVESLKFELNLILWVKVQQTKCWMKLISEH